MGPRGTVSDLSERAPADGEGDISWMEVGITITDEHGIKDFEARGSGDSWEAAFDDATTNRQ